jgi:hypothetical protein
MRALGSRSAACPLWTSCEVLPGSWLTLGQHIAGYGRSAGGAERASAWLAALLVDDFYAVGGVHDRLVLLIPVHLVVLMPELAKDLNDLAPTSGLTMDTPSLKQVTDTRLGWCVLRTHVTD